MGGPVTGPSRPRAAGRLHRLGTTLLLAGAVLSVAYLFPGAAPVAAHPSPGEVAASVPGASPSPEPSPEAAPDATPAPGAPAGPSVAPQAGSIPTRVPTSAPYRMPQWVDFVMTVPRLGYWAEVREGTSTRVLGYGPGHYSETPMPGQPGNVAVAAHNSFWYHFDRLQAGDKVYLQTHDGTKFAYTIVSSRVTEPDDIGVVVPTVDQRLTLTTCWPLWAGVLAKQRYVIVATQD